MRRETRPETRGRRPARFAAALAATVLLLTGCTAAPEQEAVTRVAFYGDSYTVGMGASDPSNRWSTIICESRGWSEFNPSVNGLGFINNRTAFGEGDVPSLIIADEPDMVFIILGINDNFSFASAADQIEQQITADFDRLRQGLPDARLIAVEPFWFTEQRPESVDIIAGWVRDAAAAVSADYIPGASRWIVGHPEWLAADGLHPNDKGHAEIARRMDEELVALGL